MVMALLNADLLMVLLPTTTTSLPELVLDSESVVEDVGLTVVVLDAARGVVEDTGGATVDCVVVRVLDGVAIGLVVVD